MESNNASADFVRVELRAGDSCGMQARRATSIVFPHERDCQTIPGPEPKSLSPCSPLVVCLQAALLVLPAAAARAGIVAANF